MTQFGRAGGVEHRDHLPEAVDLCSVRHNVGTMSSVIRIALSATADYIVFVKTDSRLTPYGVTDMIHLPKHDFRIPGDNTTLDGSAYHILSM